MDTFSFVQLFAGSQTVTANLWKPAFDVSRFISMVLVIAGVGHVPLPHILVKKDRTPSGLSVCALARSIAKLSVAVKVSATTLEVVASPATG